MLAAGGTADGAAWHRHAAAENLAGPTVVALGPLRRAAMRAWTAPLAARPAAAAVAATVGMPTASTAATVAALTLASAALPLASAAVAALTLPATAGTALALAAPSVATLTAGAAGVASAGGVSRLRARRTDRQRTRRADHKCDNATAMQPAQAGCAHKQRVPSLAMKRGWHGAYRPCSPGRCCAASAAISPTTRSVAVTQSSALTRTMRGTVSGTVEATAR